MVVAQPSIVAVYGLPVVDPEARLGPTEEPQPVRLGSGRLVADRVVILDRELERALRSDEAPTVLRVGIASRLESEPFVEVHEVRQVIRNRDRTQWAAELWTPAASPPDEPEGPIDPGDGPANGLCFFFPDLSFC